MQLRRKIARRQRLARWATHAVIPTLAVTFYVGRWSEWFALTGLALIVVEGIAMGAGKLLRCPMCDSFLANGRRGETEYFHSCPECGFIVD